MPTKNYRQSVEPRPAKKAARPRGTAKTEERVAATMRETAKAAGIGINQAYDAARRGEIPTIRIGNRLLVPRTFLRQLEGS
jgi:hypothetical protein